MRNRWLAGGLLVVSLLGAGCSDDGDELGDPVEIEVDHPGRCEFLGVDDQCLLPFPSDWYTVEDSSTDTGRRVAIRRPSTPANLDGVHIDPAELNRNDGFSPGSPIMLQVPLLDVERSGLAPVTDMAASLDEDAPIVLLDVDTGERHPYWAELDAQADPEGTPVLFIRPARTFPEGHRIVVALRNLHDTDGRTISPPDSFRVYRDRLATEVDVVEDRRDAMDDVFADLEDAGIDRDDLYLAWDFTVASERNLSERLLAMRDDAFATLDDEAPSFEVETVTPADDLLRTVTGTYEVPLFLTGEGEPGSVLNNGAGPDADPIPEQNGTYRARFLCIVPRGEVVASSLYGHGLLGSAEEVQAAGRQVAIDEGVTFCATDWIGMSSEDLGNVATILSDLSTFRSLADRLQQGILDMLFLGRLMVDPDGFGSDPAFQDAAGDPLVSENLVFNGNSQGGILGGATTAVAQDWTRAVLGVPGMNYSTLLQRSIDYDQYDALLRQAYPDEVDRVVSGGLIQMLWDRGENNGYAQHLTSDPYPDTPEHRVLLFEAFGDHQVANVATEVMARTIGARVRQPGLEDGRSTAEEPFWAIDPVATDDLPADGSFLVMWDFGTPPPPDANVPPRDGEDPHGMGGDVAAVRRMAATFLLEGELIDVCDGDPCQTRP